MKKNNIVDFEEILSDYDTEEQFFEIPLKSGVFHFIIFFVIILFSIIVSSLFFVNILKGSSYETRASRNISDEKIQEAPRGIFLDRFGKVILHNEASVNAVLSPHDFPITINERIQEFKKISSILNISEYELLKKIEARDWGQSDRLILKENLNQDELIALEESSLSGVYTEPSFVRAGENELAFSHLTGYVGSVGKADIKKNPSFSIDDKIGRAGLEFYYDNFIRGQNGKIVFFRDATGKIKEQKFIQEPKQGGTLKTFIDKDLQEYIYNRLIEGLHELGRDSGLVIAIDPRNGEVLSLVNIPGYNIKNIRSALIDKNMPLFNRAIMGTYNPGSTIKPLVATAAFTEGVIDPNTEIYSGGFIEIPNPYNPKTPSRFLDWKANGWVNMQSAIARSCNIYFYEVAGGFNSQKGIGIDKLKEWWKLFRLDKKTNIDLPGEAIGFLPDPIWKQKQKNDLWRIGDTYNVAIGQGDLSITPIALLNYIAALANGGTFYTPRIVDSIFSSSSTIIFKNDLIVLDDIKDKISSALPTVRAGMRDAVLKDYGTAYLLHDLPVKVAAKTGTAQIQNNQKTNAFFVGYAPYDNPEIAIIVLVENSREGGRNTVPIAKDIFLWYYENRLKK